MRERWMVDRARDRLAVTAAMVQSLHDTLAYGVLPRDRAEAVTVLMLTQIEETSRLLEEASKSLRAKRQPQPAEEAEPAGASTPQGRGLEPVIK